MAEIIDYFHSNAMVRDSFNVLAGEYLGAGIHRTVHRCKLDPTLVIKFEHASGCFANVMEWNIWDEAQHIPSIKRWFAPCTMISENGVILFQKYAENLPARRLPKKVPAFFTDLKPANFGLYNGHPVARDYGLCLAISRGLTGGLRKADWNT